MLWGLLLCVIFTVASAYSGLKVGQVMEAAIPMMRAQKPDKLFDMVEAMVAQGYAQKMAAENN